jgi:hypothetical protein
LNTLNYNGSNLFAFIKRTAVCILAIEWYMLFFVCLNHCEAIPFSFEPKFFNKTQMRYEIIDSGFMFFESFVIKKQSTIVISLQKSIQYGRKSIKKLFSVFSGFIFPIHIEAEQTSKQGSNNSQKPIEIIFYVVYYLGHVGDVLLWLSPIWILNPIWIQIYFMYTQQKLGAAESHRLY